MEKESAVGGINRAMTVGIITGVGMTAARILSGVYEVVTFPLPVPAEYKPILNDPEFYWTEPFSESATRKEK
jgi:putative exosortase-associated protein (TIGR04073 family)